MNEARRRFADELYAVSHAHDQDLPRLERFRNVEPATAELLGVLIRATGTRRILELGTSNGYSTIWLADAAAATGGNLVSVDADPSRTALVPGGMLAVDNVISHAHELERFRSLIEAANDPTQTAVAVGRRGPACGARPR